MVLAEALLAVLELLEVLAVLAVLVLEQLVGLAEQLVELPEGWQP